jgi:hypothetical protein
MPKLTLTKLCELVGQDRRAIAPLLDGVPYTDGPNNAHVYESAEALAAIYRCRHKDGGPQATLAEAKIRNELAAARLREITANQKLEELVSVEFSRMAIQTFINYVKVKFEELRRLGAIDRDWIDAAGRRFAEILTDLSEQHGLEFAKTLISPEEIQTLKALEPPAQPSQGQSQS